MEKCQKLEQGDERSVHCKSLFEYINITLCSQVASVQKAYFYLSFEGLCGSFERTQDWEITVGSEVYLQDRSDAFFKVLFIVYVKSDQKKFVIWYSKKQLIRLKCKGGVYPVSVMNCLILRDYGLALLAALLCVVSLRHAPKVNAQ